ncbi:MAG: glycosyltransferase family 4 protein [Fusobacteriaceae bacterium]
MKKILMLGPFPGSLNGQTIANQTVYEGLKEQYNVDKIDTLKETGFSDKTDQGKFILGKFLKIFIELFKEMKQIYIQKYDVIYMTSGQSFLGFMRFAPYMLICILKKIPYYNHIHGGYFRKMYDSQNRVNKILLNYFIKKASGMIVLGDSLKSMFEGIISAEKIFVCENGVQDDVVATEEEIAQKIERYKKDNKKRVLYLSNLMVEKGILDLLKASESFNDDEIEFNLAGAIEPSIKNIVEDYLVKYPNKIKYHGIVRGEQKKRLLLENYIFILPTYYSNEGQPISILEAYATGCAVITDESVGGIRDIFSDEVNGLSIENRNIESISSNIEKIRVEKFISTNYKKLKEKYTKQKFVERISEVFTERGNI